MDISVETIPGFIIRMNSSLLTIQVPKSVTDIYLHVSANQKFLKTQKAYMCLPYSTFKFESSFKLNFYIIRHGFFNLNALY